MKNWFLLILLFGLTETNAQPTPNLKKIEIENQRSVDEAGPESRNYMFISDKGQVHLYSNIRYEHRMFGYAKPDTKSKRLILFSVYTNDVEGNPFNCPFGSYYETAGMEKILLTYLKTTGRFAEMNLCRNGKNTKVYFLKKYIRFE